MLVGQERRAQHVGSRRLVGDEAAERVVEIGAAAHEVLGARGEYERVGQRACGLDRRVDPLDREREVVERLAAAERRVLDRRARQADCAGAPDRRRDDVG